MDPYGQFLGGCHESGPLLRVCSVGRRILGLGGGRRGWPDFTPGRFQHRRLFGSRFAIRAPGRCFLRCTGRFRRVGCEGANALLHCGWSCRFRPPELRRAAVRVEVRGGILRFRATGLNHSSAGFFCPLSTSSTFWIEIHWLVVIRAWSQRPPPGDADVLEGPWLNRRPETAKWPSRFAVFCGQGGW